MPLTKTQIASSLMSVVWKQQSRLLLCGATTHQEFKDAIVWCGKGGNVIRTVSGNEVDDFVDYLWDNKNLIVAGKFELSKLPVFGEKRPWSWTSKVCHIMNPQQYPLIYDDNIKKAYSITGVDQYEKLLQAERIKWGSKTDSDIFEYDSDIWASQL